MRLTGLFSKVKTASLLACALFISCSAFAQSNTPPELRTATKDVSIPSRPEQLKYPPFTYEPPDPKQFRVQLKSGPVAYVVPDRELPLVNIAVYVRTGNYLQPEGKE